MPAPLPIVRTVAELRAQVAAWRGAGERIGLVPTMGALHEGHLSLVELARRHAGRTVASVFVNPTQFGPSEDFDAYPRGEARDAELLAGAGCDLLYAPAAGEMYPQGFATAVTVSSVSEPLDGAARPGHFAGVATVVAQLLTQVTPDVAVFGEKDYQQLLVISRLARDLDLPVEIVGAPTARAPDGLALSSRNAYLSAAEREAAPAMQAALQDARGRLVEGKTIEQVELTGRAALERAGFGQIDYFEVRNAETLQRFEGPQPDGPVRLLAAAKLGRTRLIDNIAG